MRKPMMVAAAMIVLAAGAAAGTKEAGVWTAYDEFAQLNAACYRVYSCGPATDVLHSDDTKVQVTPPQTSWGVCSGFDSCDVCNTNPPSDPCEWELVPK